jgi:hypothetical protein
LRQRLTVYVTTVLALFALVSSIFVPDMKRLCVAVSDKGKPDGKLELQYTEFSWYTRSLGLIHECHRYQSNVAYRSYSIHTLGMGVQTVVVDFMRWITVGAGTVLAIIVLISLGIPRRSSANLRRHLADKSR